MLEIIREHPKAALVAILFHVIVILVVGVSIDWTSISKPSSGKKPTKIVNAVAVDQKLVEKELKKIKDTERKRKRQQDKAARKAREAKAERKREEKRLAILKKKSQQEKAKQLKLKKKHQAEQKAEKQRKQKLEKQLAEQKLQQQRQQQAADELKKKLDQEAQVLKVANEARRQSQLGKHSDRIREHIQNNWYKPAIVEQNGANCEIQVTAIPSGDVLDVIIIKSCGDALINKSVKDAVRRSSPLPMPPADSDLIDDFRKFNIKINYKPTK